VILVCKPTQQGKGVQSVANDKLKQRVEAMLDEINVSTQSLAEDSPEAAELQRINRKVVEAFDHWQQALISYKEVTQHTRKMEELARENFREVVEEPAASVENLLVCKEHLLRTQSQWQAWCEMQAQAIEERKGARELVKAAANRFQDVMKNVRQLEMSF
jgi:hypothetical protein